MPRNLLRHMRCCIVIISMIGLATLTACRSANQLETPRATSQEGSAPVTLEAVSATGRYTVRYAFRPTAVPLNEMFAIDVEIRHTSTGMPAGDLSLSVDGRMPEHRHGMNVEPIITRLGPGAFRVEGMLFHMPGRWEVHFDLSRGGLTERAWMELFLE